MCMHNNCKIILSIDLDKSLQIIDLIIFSLVHYDLYLFDKIM